MAARLDLQTLRHYASRVDVAQFDRVMEAPEPRLMVAWQLGADGRLVCRWTTARLAVTGVPPD